MGATFPLIMDERLAQLTHLADANLWRVAQMRVAPDRAERMQALVWKQQGEGLTTAEEDEARQLQHYAQQVMLIRAEAAALLVERGHDVVSLRDSTGYDRTIEAARERGAPAPG
jgi:hypothetical protein